MPLFALTGNRCINTEHVCDIKYTPAGSMPAIQRTVAETGDLIREYPPNPDAYLVIELKSTERIRLSGGEADIVRTNFQQAMQSPR